MKLQETAKDFQRGRTQMHSDFLASSSKTRKRYLRFIYSLPLRASVLHEVTRLAECHFMRAQRANAIAQRMVRVLLVPKSHLNALTLIVGSFKNQTNANEGLK